MSERQSRKAWLASMDAGIAPFVNVLDSHGIETYESCQGGDGHSYPEPTIHFFGEYADGFRALAVALQHGLPVQALKRIWTVDRSGEPHGPNWELIFRRRARLGDVNDEWLRGTEMQMFARAYSERIEAA